MSVGLSVYLTVYPSVCLSLCPSVSLSLCLSVHLSVCLSVTQTFDDPPGALTGLLGFALLSQILLIQDSDQFDF